MSLLISRGIRLQRGTAMSWRITSRYTPAYPTSPTNGQTWMDPNTGITWVYSTGASSWSVSP